MCFLVWRYVVARIINIFLAVRQTQEKEERNSVLYGIHGADPSAKSPFSWSIVPYPFQSGFLSIPLTKRKSEGTEQVLRILDFLSKSSQISYVIMGISILDC